MGETSTNKQNLIVQEEIKARSESECENERGSEDDGSRGKRHIRKATRATAVEVTERNSILMIRKSM